MQPQSQMPPSMPPSGPPPGPPPANAGGHGAFSEEEIQQIMAETGTSYEQVCAAIDQTGATSKEQIFPQFYQGLGIEPQGAPMAVPAETVAPGMVQGQPPNTSPNAMSPTDGDYAINRQAGMPPTDAPMAAAPAEPEGISPEVAQAMHDELSPMAKYRRMRR